MLKAQVSPFKHTRWADSVLLPINKSGVKLLYDRVIPYANLSYYDAPDTTDYAHFTQGVYELYALSLRSVFEIPTDTIIPPTGSDIFINPIFPNHPNKNTKTDRDNPPPTDIYQPNTGNPVVDAAPVPPIGSSGKMPLPGRVYNLQLANLPPNPKFPTRINPKSISKPEIMERDLAISQQPDIIPLAVLLYDFHYIDSSSFRLGLLGQEPNGRLKDMPNRSRSPFVAKKVFLATPIRNEIKTSSVSFEYHPRNFYFNNTLRYTALEVSLDNGSFQFAWLHLPKIFTFTGITAGRHILNFRLRNEKTDDYYICQASFDCTGNLIGGGSGPISTNSLGPNPLPSTTSWRRNLIDTTFRSKIAWRNEIDETVPKYGYINAQLLRPATIQPNDLRFYKPIIIVDGFDPGDERNIEGIKDKLKYRDNLNQDKNLYEDFTTLGHDVIIANFPDGADYIQRNGQALIELINFVASRRKGNDSLTLVGPSMGGVIGRYALAYMEKRGINHCCKLFISFDSPHLGSNIPIGLQRFIKNFAENSPSYSAMLAWERSLKSPAARQLLLHHALSESLIPYPDALRKNLLDTLEFYGWPMIPYKVAIANGRGDGSGLAYAGGAEALRMTIEGRNLVRASGFLVGAMFGGLFGAIVGGSVTTESAVSRVYISPAPGQVNKDVAVVKYPFKNPTYYLANGLPESRSDLPLDVLPGGTYNSFLSVNGFRTTFLKVSLHHSIPIHSFIPTLSAICYLKPNFSWTENIKYVNLVCTGLTPFYAYYINPYNMEHIGLNMGIVDYVTKAVENPRQLVSLQVGNAEAPVVVSRRVQLCAGESTRAKATITMAAPLLGVSPTNPVFYWKSLDPDLRINGQTNEVSSTDSVTIKYVGTSNQFRILKITCRVATVINCPRFKYDTLRISVGAMKPIFKNMTYCHLPVLLDYRNDAPGYGIFNPSNMEWKYTNSSNQIIIAPNLSLFGYYYLDWKVGIEDNNYARDSVVLKGKFKDGSPSSCIPIEFTYVFKKISCMPQPPPDPVVSAYPNILTGQQSFRLNLKNMEIQSGTVYTITDNYGKIWQTGKIDKADTEISIANLPKVSALYQINIQSGSQRGFTRLGIVR